MKNYGKRQFYGSKDASSYTRHCVIFGPRGNINVTADLTYKLTCFIRDLILFNKVKEFRFTGIGRLDAIYHSIVSDFQRSHRDIKRILYVERSSWNKADFDLPTNKFPNKKYEDIQFVFTNGLVDRKTDYHIKNYLTIKEKKL